MLKREIIISHDGSHTISIPELGEQYHSIYGALTETMHVFIKMGLEFYVSVNPKKQIRILEMGFGTGLNALATLAWQGEKGCEILYTSLEAYPLQEHEYDKLNFENLLTVAKSSLSKMHKAPWGQFVELADGFKLKKINIKLQDYVSESKSFDIVFFDAFAPDKQEDLWTEDIFRKMFDALDDDGVLVTYCAKGSVRRAMQSACFTVQRLEGPPHKREMLRAIK